MRRQLVVILLAVFSSACAGTFSQVTPQASSGRPAEKPKILVVGDVQVADPVWQQYPVHFRKGVSDWLKKNGGFDQIITEGTATPGSESVVLTGTLTEMDKGSAAARFFVGMGAGQAKAKGDFEPPREDVTVLTKFTARRSYLGGAGIGGASFLDMDELAGRLGETVAETIVKWLRGEKMD